MTGDRTGRSAYNPTRAAFPDGHFYSPVIDAKDLAKRRKVLWGSASPELPGVDFNAAGQRALLQELREIGAEYP